MIKYATVVYGYRDRKGVKKMENTKNYETYIKLFKEAYNLGVTELFNEVYKLGYSQGYDDAIERFIDDK